MCGIVGGITKDGTDMVPILIEGLKRLEYRGYDSAGIAVITESGILDCTRVLGKVSNLEVALDQKGMPGNIGIAHTRWATHGEPSVKNAHPHVSGGIALIHNGIIENHPELREELQSLGYEFTSATDTEVIAHEIHRNDMFRGNLLIAVNETVKKLKGAYALGVIGKTERYRLIAARKGSPLVIGLGGENGNYIASDVFALLPVTKKFIFLEDGDVADIRADSFTIYDSKGHVVNRPVQVSQLSPHAMDKAGYRHYMLKEIFTQARAMADTLEGRIADGRVSENLFGPETERVLFKTDPLTSLFPIDFVHIVACGTSFHAGLVIKYLIESITGIRCSVEPASEFRYRDPIVHPNTLFVTLSQSGETADTLEALRLAKRLGCRRTLAICNTPESSLTRESDLVFLTRAGQEIGVASTKAFTTQLAALSLLLILIGRKCGRVSAEQERGMVSSLETLPGKINAVLSLDARIQALAEQFMGKQHVLFLGRGTMYPIAMEGALKLKEISYIDANAYPAGELKHGPIALVDEEMPVIAIAPRNGTLEKLKSNLEEVRARKGQVYVFADEGTEDEYGVGSEVIVVPGTRGASELVLPILHTIPLQLLAYHVAVLNGTDIDQPRNLAKSVTVE